MEQKKSRAALWVVLGLALGLPALGFFVYGVFIGFEVEAEAADRDRVFNVEDVDLAGFEFDASKESLVRTRYIDGTVGLEYTYETDNLYVWCLYSDEHTERDARNVFTGQSAGGQLITAFQEGTELVERPDLFRWGDQSKSKVFVVDGVEAGYSIDVRQGTKVFGIIVVGVEFPHPGALQTQVVSALERSLALSP